TLSPMMGSKLLRAGDTERGFAGWINRRFDAVRDAYQRTLAGSLAYRPVVYVVWGIVVFLIAPFYMFSQRELAPTEDQSVVFGIIQASANSTLDQTRLYAAAVQDVYRSFPEYQHTFQLVFPSGGFGGMVTKPWSERKRKTEQIQLQAAAGLSKIPG